MHVTIDPITIVNAGPDQTVCADSPAVTLAGSFGGGAASAGWSTAGTGTFDDANALNAVYTPSGADISTGSVTLTLTTDDPSGPCGAVSDSMVVTIDRVTATNITFVRPAGSSLKISKANLLAHAADSDAETLTLAGVGTDGVNLLTTNGADHQANAPPITAARRASIALSTITSCTRRHRPAPMETRSAISRARAAACAVIMLAMFAQAINSTSATSTPKAANDRR
jgi:hypothetical protein